MDIMNEERLTAEQVRAMDAGTRVRMYHYDRFGEIVYERYTVVQSGRKKALRLINLFGYLPEIKPITKESDRRWYTMDR